MKRREREPGAGQVVESFRVLALSCHSGACDQPPFTSSLSATALHVTEGGHEVQVDVMILGYENTEEIIAVQDLGQLPAVTQELRQHDTKDICVCKEALTGLGV